MPVKITGKFVDDDGEREFNDVVPPNGEGEKAIDVWVKSFRIMLTDALKSGDDVEILVTRKRTCKYNSMYI